ncbi:MAG: hypothetical protein ACRD96_08960, partial [Bryobacteraceae bacterium]
MAARIKNWLRLAGKGDRKVIAVFATTPDGARRAIEHVHAQAPVWLFATCDPPPGTAALCERVVVAADSMKLLIEAQKTLWPAWVALAVATWTGSRGAWPVKLAPLAVPPFRALLMNEHGDFFSTSGVATHLRRRLRDAAHSARNRVRDVNRGAWLWVFAAIAQRFAWLSRRAFRSHGGQTLTPAAGDPGEGLITFRHPLREWNHAEVERLVRDARARWILFLEGGAASPVDDLLPLFDDPTTFAVSRQSSYRAWNEGLFATAPFRALQPEEASRTLAPVSPAILVDRSKLAAIGLPRTIVPGSAWLQLFWKAAAAGWKCWSIGTTSPIGASPDRPYEEAEIVTRVLGDPALRALGPREADLARGSIACAPAQRRSFRGLPRV